MLRRVFSLASPGGAAARLSIFIFHRVLPVEDPLFPDEPTAARFDQTCGWLARWFHVLPLDEAVRRLEAASLPPRAAAITFDDGYADNHDVALPILQRHGLSATFFIATGFLDGGRMWNDTVIEAVRRTPHAELDLSGLLPGGPAPLPLRASVGDPAARRALIDRLLPRIKYLPTAERQSVVDELASRARAPLPGDLMMRSDQVLALYGAGMGIGAHTVNHPILARLDREQARAEIAGSRDHLQALLGDRVTLFAYPNGKPNVDYNRQSVEVVRDLGFDGAVSTGWGAAMTGTDQYQLPRFTPWDRAALPFAVRTLRNMRSAVTVAA